MAIIGAVKIKESLRESKGSFRKSKKSLRASVFKKTYGTFETIRSTLEGYATFLDANLANSGNMIHALNGSNNWAR